MRTGPSVPRPYRSNVSSGPDHDEERIGTRRCRSASIAFCGPSQLARKQRWGSGRHCYYGTHNGGCDAATAQVTGIHACAELISCDQAAARRGTAT